MHIYWQKCYNLLYCNIRQDRENKYKIYEILSDVAIVVITVNAKKASGKRLLENKIRFVFTLFETYYFYFLKSFNTPVINSKNDMNFSSLSFLTNSIVSLSVFLYFRICLTHSSGFFVDTKAHAVV